MSKKILRSIIGYRKDPDSRFNLNKLLEMKYQYFEIEDHYGFGVDGEVSGELRQVTINTLVEIYTDWKKKLEEQNFEYYLAIWLYLPRMSKSQVVCAIEEKIEYYDKEAFIPGKKDKKFEPLNFGKMSDSLKNITWELKIDLDSLYEWEVNFPRQNWERLNEYSSDQKIFKKNIEKSIRVIGNNEEKIYLFPVGDVWIGKVLPTVD